MNSEAEIIELEFLRFFYIKVYKCLGPEYMWVLVEKLGTQGTELEGTLDNDPVYDVGYECGDYIGSDVSEIADVDDLFEDLEKEIIKS